jgi:hypothetical protein
MASKKAQLSIFIILAVLLVIITTVLGVMYKMGFERITEEEVTLRLNEEAPLFNSVIGNCLSLTSKQALQQVAIQGRIDPERYFTYLDTNVYQATDRSISLKELEGELSESIQENIKSCVKDVVKETEKKGFKITREESSLTTSIDHSDVRVTMHQPITLSLQSQDRESETFSHVFEVRLQPLWNTSVNVVHTYKTTPNLINLTYLDSLDFTTTIIPYEEVNLFIFEDNKSNLVGQNYMYSIAVG